MRTSVLGLLITLALLPGGSGQASVVIHDGQPGIVATSQDGWALDNLGHSWNCSNGGGGGWFPDDPSFDVPIGVENIKFWMHDRLISTSNELWMRMGPDWTNFGVWPASAVVEPAPQVLTSAIHPNPSLGSCRISFAVTAAGPFSVRLFDASGRIVRVLLEGQLPAGEYSPTWDGKDAAGVDAAAGVYFFKVTTTSGESGGQVVLTR